MRRYTTLLCTMLFMVMTFAQNNTINYKAVVKDGSGNLVTNQSIGVQFTVLEDAGISYIETHAATTDANGIVILNIGQGTATTSTFDAINWTKTTTLKTEIDIDGGLDNLVDMGTTEFKTVPYALTAGNTAFSTTANVTSNAPGAIATDDFVFGSTELAHSAASNVKDYRMYFDKSKGALRAGSTENFGAFPTDGTAWDDTNVGENSLAAGFNTIASEFASSAFGFETSASAFAATAMGFLTTASGPGSTAMGDATTASGERSTAMGILTKAEAYGSTAIGINNVGGGDPSMYPPLPTSPMFEIGNGTYGTSSNALTVLYDGLIIAPSLTTTMIANEATGKVLVTKEYIDAQAGAFSTAANVTSNAPGDIDTDDFVFGSAQLAHSAPSMVKDYRMFFDQSKGAFRAGSTENNGSLDGSAWNEVNIGENSFASGINTEASGNSSTAMGVLTTASGTFSTAMGNSTIASGNFSTAMGSSTFASGGSSTAMGDGSEASGSNSTAMGSGSTASGTYATSMGFSTTASETSSTSMGFTTTASGTSSTSMGFSTTASGAGSTAMGSGSEASGDASTAIGFYTKAEASASTALGTYNVGGGNPTSFPPPDTNPIFEIGNGVSGAPSNALTVLYDGTITAPSFDLVEITDPKALVTKEYADGQASQLEAIDEGNGMGWRLKGRDPANYGPIGFGGVDLSFSSQSSSVKGATGAYSTAMGNKTNASGQSSVAMGFNTTASSDYTTAMGIETTASGGFSTAMGANTTASGLISTAMGSSTFASGESSTAMGSSTTASGTYATSLGFSTTASETSSTSMGFTTTASGFSSTSMGFSTTASRIGSTAMGYDSEASGDASTAIGFNTKAEAYGSMAIGTYNVGGGNPTLFPPPDTNPIFEIGNGDSGAPSNALTVLYDGTITAPSFDLAEITDPKALVTKEYADGQASQLEAIDEGNGIGWRLKGRDPAYYGPIGLGAVDFSFSQLSSSNNGATRLYSTAMGLDTTASNFTATAMGDGTIASGQASTAIGFGTKAEGFASTSIGAFNVGGGNPTSFPPPDTNPIFEIGNGVVGAPSNALTVLYDGTTTINGKTIINEEATINGLTTINGQAIINEQTTINAATIVNDDTPDVNVRAISGIKTHIANVNDVAVYGENTSTDNFGIGVQGNGGTRGVLGNASGVGSGEYVGVQGNSIANNSGINIGVFGDASNFGSGGSAAVYAAGNLLYTGTLVNASDRKLKTNISTISNSLEAISRLNPTTYSIKESYQKSMNMSSKPQFGFLAQELQEVFPDLVSSNVHPGTIEEAASIEYLGVNYIGLIPILTKGMQEQQDQIEAQQAIIEQLVARIEALENR